MTVERWTPERRLERTRAALVQSARHVFAVRGFEGASLDEIADGAGYTRGAIYKHFSNKEDLLFAVIDNFAEQINVDARSALDTKQTATTWFKALAGHREMWALSVELHLYEYRNPDVARRCRAWRLDNRQNIAAFIEHHAALTGITFKVPAETAAALLLNASDGFLQAAHVDSDAEALFATFLDLFIPAIMETPPETR
jgi:AcrR family transcriptional regulator